MEDTQKRNKKKKIADMISKHPYTVMELNLSATQQRAGKEFLNSKQKAKM